MRPPTGRRGARQALGLILVGSTAIQLSSALAARLFASLGPLPVSSLRTAIAAVILCAVFRPRLRGRSRAQWASVVAYGVAMAAMNLCLYSAIDRIPLGVAVTLEFLGPCAVAFLASRRVREGLCAVAAFAGVLLISGPGGHFDAAGYAFGLGAAAFFALYTVFAEKVGKGDAGLSGLALSVTVAAVVSAPFGIGDVAGVTAGQWLVLAAVAAMGVAVPYAVDTVAARVSSARVVGTLFSIDPVVGSLAGFLVLREHLGWLSVTGILVVAAAGAAVVWCAGPPPVPEPPPAQAEPAAAAGDGGSGTVSTTRV
ncbi:DMT family transporter [Streptomyces sp. NPDC059740]|uniref:EamA family transporter n=1 Tax=Streptomyces sp. NPDC059740 TaxID=3346926 RepID=UPI00364C507C